MKIVYTRVTKITYQLSGSTGSAIFSAGWGTRLNGSEGRAVEAAPRSGSETQTFDEEDQVTQGHQIRVDHNENMARFYKIDVQPTLFGQWSLVRGGVELAKPAGCPWNCMKHVARPI
jgi:hypothetical protein